MNTMEGIVGRVSDVPVARSSRRSATEIPPARPRPDLGKPPRESVFPQAECESRSDIAYEVDFGEIDDSQAVPAPQSCSQHWGEAPAEPGVPESVVPGSRLSRSFALPNWLAATPRLSVAGALAPAFL